MTQGETLAILKTGANVFLTGEPGSGKTHTVNAYTEWLRSCAIEPSITAATGIAATHVGGMTLHSWSGIGIKESLSESDVDAIASKEHVARRIMKAKVLIIDEVSMLSAATFSMADRVCREVRRRDTPFGGVQVVLVGDFFQLPPVQRSLGGVGAGANSTQFAFASSTWHQLNPIACYLSEQYRQDDADFLAVLSAIRRNDVEEWHYEQLMARHVSRESTATLGGVPKLFSHNADVDRLNAVELEKLSGGVKRFRMASKGREAMIEGLKRGCLSPETLELKEGAAVMFTKNSPQGGFVNGTLGTVMAFEAGSNLPRVETRDGLHITVEPMEWQVEENGKVRASVTQVPLRLAYAMTVHKSQGMSMDAAVIDLSQAFEYGQGYVALSRVRRLAGLHLLGMNAQALRVHPDILEKDSEFRELSEAAAASFAGLPEAELSSMHKQFVKAMGGAMLSVKSTVGRDAGKKNTKKGMNARLAETLQAVRDSKSLREAAKARNLTKSTIVRHLEDLQKLGLLAPADFEHILPDERARKHIALALAEKGGERLAPAFNALQGSYDYEVIRLVRLAGVCLGHE